MIFDIVINKISSDTQWKWQLQAKYANEGLIRGADVNNSRCTVQAVRACMAHRV